MDGITTGEKVPTGTGRPKKADGSKASLKPRKQVMKETKKPTITDAATDKTISAAQALELIQSAVGYCHEAGLQPKFLNRAGVLWLAIPGAELVTNEDGKAVVRLLADVPEVHVPEPKDGEHGG